MGDCTIYNGLEYIYLFIIHTKLMIEGNAQNIQTTQLNMQSKALKATHGSKLNCLSGKNLNI